MFSSGIRGIPKSMAPLFISLSKGINDICKGTIIIATTKRNAISLPRKSMNANAYAANAAIVIGIMVDGIVTAKELKNDLKGDVRRIETLVEDVETRVKEDSRTNEKELKELVKEIEEDMADLETKVSDTIQKTLANPLAGMK